MIDRELSRGGLLQSLLMAYSNVNIVFSTNQEVAP